jgi:hypothetical protein
MIRSHVILLLIICFSCTTQKNNKNESIAPGKDSVSTHSKEDTVSADANREKHDTVISVLVLPAYDEIANGGASPDTQYILEKTLSNHDTLKVLPFRLQKLMGVRYQMVYDKKYCQPILDKVPTDIIIMSRIITKNEHEPGIWPWAYEVKIYNVKTNKQITSIRGKDLEAENFSRDINSKKDKLLADIFNTFN